MSLWHVEIEGVSTPGTEDCWDKHKMPLLVLAGWECRLGGRSLMVPLIQVTAHFCRLESLSVLSEALW